jgi:transcriptional regulator with XRE-family HTH domain
VKEGAVTAPKQGVDLLASEDALARRITYEREERGWSPGGLADLMTKAGVPMNQSAIWKIEKGEPRRKITVTELLGFTKVFELSVGDLLTAPELIPHQRAQKLCAQWIWRFNQFENALVSCDRARTKLAAHLADHPDATEALGAQVADYFKGGVAEADEIVDQVTAQAELIAELLEED